mgnify:CR=1 FL=1
MVPKIWVAHAWRSAASAAYNLFEVVDGSARFLELTIIAAIAWYFREMMSVGLTLGLVCMCVVRIALAGRQLSRVARSLHPFKRSDYIHI